MGEVGDECNSTMPLLPNACQGTLAQCMSRPARCCCRCRCLQTAGMTLEMMAEVTVGDGM